MVRAMEATRLGGLTRRTGRAAYGWMALAGSAIGFAFLTKMGQGLLVLPAFVVVYLVCSRAKLVPRLLQLLTAAVALVVSAGCSAVAGTAVVVAVAGTPASAAPPASPGCSAVHSEPKSRGCCRPH